MAPKKNPKSGGYTAGPKKYDEKTDKLKVKNEKSS